MENGRSQCLIDKDLRVENGDFCRMWGCRNFKAGYTCHWCPVLADIKRMAMAFNVKFQIIETVTEKSVENCVSPHQRDFSSALDN
ncbi:MAG: hypothetical protein JW915_04595 [Chitinispirillaceae bacterium]|nr:hypothetical protein [Chitinispirillaceae bacterium]